MLFSDWYIKVGTITSTTGTGGWQYVTSANEKCYLTTYPKHCTTYEFLENKDTWKVISRFQLTIFGKRQDQIILYKIWLKNAQSKKIAKDRM